MTTNISKWGDQHQYLAAPMQVERTEDGNILPKVHLLWMTPDPLGAVAAMGRMYKGIPTYHLNLITDDERLGMWEQCKHTHLQAPLEAIKLHFFIEGVTRSFTHQMVRQRTAVYAQESLRFAVKEDLASEVSLPPSIARLKKDDPRRIAWDKAIDGIASAYTALVNSGIPSEDARGLLPHATTTRLNFITDFRNLKDHMGNRLCTQAQFEWRLVAIGIVAAIRSYTGGLDDEWQYPIIAESDYFRPVCYHLGHCPFQADFDRSCTIRKRVEDHARHGQHSTTWDDIDAAEWLLSPDAARKTGGAGHD